MTGKRYPMYIITVEKKFFGTPSNNRYSGESIWASIRKKIKQTSYGSIWDGEIELFCKGKESSAKNNLKTSFSQKQNNRPN